MNKKWGFLIRACVAFVLVFSSVPTMAFAEDGETQAKDALVKEVDNSTEAEDSDSAAESSENDNVIQDSGPTNSGSDASSDSGLESDTPEDEDTESGVRQQSDDIAIRANGETCTVGSLQLELDRDAKTLTIKGSGKVPISLANDSTFSGWLNEGVIENLVFGEGITSLEDYCFSSMMGGINIANLKSVEFLGDDISLGMMTFCFVSTLEKVILPTSITEISMYAFLNCDSLSVLCNQEGEMSFPNLMYIGDNAFSATLLSGEMFVAAGCQVGSNALPDGLTIKMNYITSGIDSASGVKWEVATQGAEKVLTLSYTGSGTGVLPAGSYGSSAGGVAKWLDATDPDVYSSKGITKIILGEGIVELSEWCFNNANGIWPNVKSISLPASVQKIGENAFTSLATMTSFTIAPNSQLKELTPATGGSPRGAWGNCSSLTKLDLSSTQLTAWTPEIMGCSNLSELVFPVTLGSIGENSFSSAPKLTHLVVPTNVSQIHENAFNASSIQEVVLSCPVVLSSIPSGLKMIYCGIQEEQLDQNDLNHSKELWNNSSLAGNYTLTFQPHQCSAGHALTSGQSVDLTCSVCGTGAGVSVEKNGYDYDVKVTAKNMASYLANPVNVYFPDLVNNFATVDGKFYQGVDLADGLRFAKSATVETFKDANGQPVALTVDGLDEAPGELVDHETYGEVDAIKASLLETLGSAEEATAFHHAHLMAGSSEFDFADLPVSSLTFELPFPVDFPGLYDFSVAHMIDSSDHPRLDVGQIETLDASRSNTGIRVTVNSLSPFAVSYAEIPTTEVSTPATPASAGMVGSALSPTGDDAGKPLANLAMLAAAGVLSAAVFEAKRRGALKHFVRVQR